MTDREPMVVEASEWPAVAKKLATQEGFRFLSDLCAVDWPAREKRFEIVYHLTNMETPAQLRVKV